MPTLKRQSGKNTPKKREKKWLIAVDPFAGFDLEPVLNFAGQTARKAGAKLQAVYILAPAALNWTGEFNGAWMKRYLPVAKAKLDEVLKGFDWQRRVIPCHEAGLKEAVKALASFGESHGADCLLICTHGRRGIERMALGSFAESLILSSKIPVLIMNPLAEMPETVHKILIPTDLDRTSARFVSDMADYAHSLGAEVVLYYKQPDPLDPIVQQGVYSLGGGWVSLQSFVDDEVKRKSKELERLEKMLRDKGVTVSHVLDTSPGDLIESIEKAARDQGADLVSVRTQAGGWTATLLGSVARGLVRHAQFPVLVQR